MHLVSHNPARLVPAPQVTKTKAPAVTPADEEKLRAELWQRIERYESRVAALILFVLDTGLRAGEVTALRWSDIVETEDGPFVSISRAVSWPAHNRPVLGPPKSSAGIRMVPLIDSAVQTLASIPAPHLDGKLIFGTENNTYARQPNVRRMLVSVCKSAGVPYTSLHSLRRTLSTRLFRAGVPDKIRAQVLGHSSFLITDDIYISTDQGDAASAFREHL